MDRAPEPSVGAAGAAWPLVLGALVAVVLLMAAFLADGSGVDGVLPVGGAAMLLLAVAAIAVAVGLLRLPYVGRTGAALVLAMVLLTMWTGATVVWSILPDRSWDTFNRTAVFAACLALGVVLGGAGGRFAARIGAGTVAAVTAVVLGWALLAKVVPSLDPDGDRVARLREPVGYWNALALLADIALVLGLWLGGREHRTVVRVAGSLLTYAATLALMLTLSRAGVVVGVVVVVLWLVLSSRRLESGLLLLGATVPAMLVGAWAYTRPALVEDVATRADRETDGSVLGVLTLVGALVVVLCVVVGSRREVGSESRRRLARALAAVAVLAVVAAGAGVAAAGADAVSAGRSCSEVENDPSRLGSLDLNQRICWWHEAWKVFEEHAPGGAGAGTFEVARKRHRIDARSVLEPHSVPLQLLSDGGWASVGLFALLVLAASATCVCAFRRLDGPERVAAGALVAVPAAYLGHAVVDYDWNFLAVTAPAMVALGVLAGAGRPQRERRRRPLLALGAVLLAAGLLVSFTFPRVAERMERSSTRALSAGQLDRARDRALWARFFNPLSVEPLHALARVAERERAPLRAEQRYIEAVELQPENPEAWYTLGLFEYQVRGNLCAAYRFLNNAYTYDPAGNQWTPGGPLDVARDAVNEGGCAPGS